MSTREFKATRTRNHLLAALPDSDYDRLLPQIESTFLSTRQVLIEENRPIEHAYFPVNCVISVLARTDEDVFAEVATIGREGMAGTPLLLGMDTTPHRCFAQIPGECLRITAEAFRDEVTRGGPFVTILNRYLQMLMVQVAQGVACNSRHSIKQRCARWLLMSRDRVEWDEFPLTQEFLGQMLGVRRASVSEIASEFQRDGLIHYTRGNITILDRDRLERIACDCYHIVRDVYSQPLLPELGRPAQA